MKRLYVGGLGHTVSEKDLRDRFGKFGKVSDVEIIARKDEDGSPLKIFGYININISESDYKRCLTVLNKSKWKGGTLQIELAKESFLHQLAEERQKAAEKTPSPSTNAQEKIVESFKAAGVENFHMKAAVPGTEIPGHENWVVSKFGRVLPVVHLKCEGKNKVFKYDPSKHCHNIKKLDAEETITPVSKLTWEIDGGYDEISKKRRGEFPPQKKVFKRNRKDLHLSATAGGLGKVTGERRTSAEAGGDDPSEEVRISQNRFAQRPVCVLDGDGDSEDEIRKLVIQEHSRNQRTESEKEDENNLDVVGEDFVVKSNLFWGGEYGTQLALNSSKNGEEYDSADTDEILTQKKTVSKAEKPSELEAQIPITKSSKGRKKVQKKAADTPKPNSVSDNGDGSHESSSESVDSHYEAMMGNCYRLDLSLADLENLAKNAEEASDDEEGDEGTSETQAGPSKVPKSSITRPSSKKSGNTPEDILAWLFEPDVEKKEKKKAPKSSLPAFVGTKDLFSSIDAPSGSGLKRSATKMDCESGEEPKRLKEDPKRVPKKVNLEGKGKDQLSGPSCLSASVDSRTQPPSASSSSECSSSSDEMETSKESEAEDDKTETIKVTNGTDSAPSCQSGVASSSAVGHSGHEEDAVVDITEASKTCENLVKKKAAPASKAAASSSSEESETSDEEEENMEAVLKGPISTQANESTASRPRRPQQTVSDALKQQQDNQKRLAALEQRLKEAEQQKKLIQGALSTLDVPNANKGKHIVFDSDDEDDNDEEPPTAQKKSLFEEDSESGGEEDGSGSVEKRSLKVKECKKAEGSKLFDSDEDEDDEEDRFQIKPQFEGRAGQKLMELQSRFGTDPRFQMDEKFLEKDDEVEEQDEESQAPAEQELVEEKKKNLEILQSILNVNIRPNKESSKGKTFRDVSALHYDPTSEAHAAFEKKTEAPEKESKAARRKKREEAQKLPEVSKEIYYDVAVDLKEVFGTIKEDQNEKKEELSWDKEEDEEEEAAAGDAHVLGLSSGVKAGEEESSGFKFSFFGGDSAAAAGPTPKTDEYKVETLKGAKVPWQVDPRFQDSSSEEEDEGDKEKNEEQPASATITPEEPAPMRTFFFFFEGDTRLKEGPRKFCRKEKLEDQREAWEERRNQLREEYRKKHKDAKRLQKAAVNE